MLHSCAEQGLATYCKILRSPCSCWTFAPARHTAGGGPEREEMDIMGHSFGLLDIGMSNGRLDARQSDTYTSIRRFSAIALGLAIALILPISRAAAQTTSPAPSAESDVQLLQPAGPGQSTPPT